MWPTYAGIPYAGAPDRAGHLLLIGSGTLTFTAAPAFTGTAILGGRGKLSVPGGTASDTTPVRVMAIKSGISAESQRFAYQGDVEPAGVDLARSGVFPTSGSVPADLVKVTALQAKVTPFQAFIAGASTLQPGYRVTVDEDTTLTFAAGSGTDPRIDLVVLRVRDNPYDASGSQLGTVEVVQGTPAASPTAPAVPATAIPLWQVTVGAAVTGAVGIDFANARTDRRYYTASVGGHVTVSSMVERDALVAPYEGLPVWRGDLNWSEVYDGTAWRVIGVPIVPNAAALSNITNPFDGQVAVAFANNDLLQYDQATSAWVSFVASALPTGYSTWPTYTPLLTQNGNIPKTVNSASYSQAGKTVTAAVSMTCTGLGTAGVAIKAGLPVTALRSSGAVGRGFLYDASASTYYTFVVVMDSTTQVKFVGPTTTGFLGATGGGFTAQVASGDVVAFTVTYEAA